MRDRPWRTLVRELTEAGHESPYLDRLRQRLDVAQGRTALEIEIVHEMATALGRAEEKLLVALLELEIAALALDGATDARERRDRVVDFNAARERALRRRWELGIHREAIGIGRNEILEGMYPIAGRVPLDE